MYAQFNLMPSQKKINAIPPLYLVDEHNDKPHITSRGIFNTISNPNLQKSSSTFREISFSLVWSIIIMY